MSDERKHILNLSAEYKYGPDDPCPSSVRVGCTGDELVSKDISRVVARLVRSLTVGWEDFDMADFVAYLIFDSQAAIPEQDPDYPEYHAEEQALADMISAADRFWKARMFRETRDADVRPSPTPAPESTR